MHNFNSMLHWAKDFKTVMHLLNDRLYTLSTEAEVRSLLFYVKLGV